MTAKRTHPATVPTGDKGKSGFHLQSRSGRRLGAFGIIGAAILLVATVATYTSVVVSAKAKPHLTTVTYLTDYLASGEYVGIEYAEKHGFYTKQGINLDLEYGTGSATTSVALASGKVDVGDIFGGVLATAVSGGAPLISVGSFQTNAQFAFFCDQKLHVTKMSQLAGKTVIIPPGTVQAEMYGGALLAAGVAVSSVQVLSVASSIAGSTYAHGTGDCISEGVSDSAVFQPLRPSTTMLWTSVGFNPPGYDFVVSKAYLSSHKSLIAGFLRASYEGIVGARRHPKAGVKAFESYNPTFSEATATTQWKEVAPAFCIPDQVKAHEVIGYTNAKAFTQGVAALVKYAALPASVTASELYTNEFFAKPYRVSTVKC